MSAAIDATEAQAAAAAIVDAFGVHDRDRYFAGFSPDATFLFYTTDRLLGSRAEYETEWSSWEAGGFRVNGCTSFNQRVEPIADSVVVFTHDVHTRVFDGSADLELDERETIVLRREPDGRWLGIHEHLSPTPSAP